MTVDQRLPHLSTPHYSALFSVLQRTSAYFSALQRSSAHFSVNHRCSKIGLNNQFDQKIRLNSFKMLILLFYFNNISSRLSLKKIVKGTPRNRTSTLPHQQHSHNQQAFASCRHLRAKLLESITHLILLV